MRAAFLLAILFLSALYGYYAFAELDFLGSTGRLGPGFFPRIIGLGLVATCLYCLYVEMREREPEEPLSAFWNVTIVVALLSGLFVLALSILGGLLSMVVFMLAALFLLNRDHPVQNVLVATLLPISVYVLFDVWLNAAVPDGIIPLPI